MQRIDAVRSANASTNVSLNSGVATEFDGDQRRKTSSHHGPEVVIGYYSGPEFCFVIFQAIILGYMYPSAFLTPLFMSLRLKYADTS